MLTSRVLQSVYHHMTTDENPVLKDVVASVRVKSTETFTLREVEVALKRVEVEKEKRPGKHWVHAIEEVVKNPVLSVVTKKKPEKRTTRKSRAKTSAKKARK